MGKVTAAAEETTPVDLVNHAETPSKLGVEDEKANYRSSQWIPAECQTSSAKTTIVQKYVEDTATPKDAKAKQQARQPQQQPVAARLLASTHRDAKEKQQAQQPQAPPSPAQIIQQEPLTDMSSSNSNHNHSEEDLAAAIPLHLERQSAMNPPPQVGAVAVIPPFTDVPESHPENEVHEVEDDDISESSSGSALPEATPLRASIVKKEEEAQQEFEQLQQEMEDKKQEMQAMQEKLAHMERMQQELEQLRSAVEGKVAVAELVEASSPAKPEKRIASSSSVASSSARRATRRGSSTGGGKKQLDPAQEKAAKRAMAPADRKKMKNAGMDLVDFMAYQYLVGDGVSVSSKDRKAMSEPRRKGHKRDPKESSNTLSLATKSRGSSELSSMSLSVDVSALTSGTSTRVFDQNNVNKQETDEDKVVTSPSPPPDSASKKRTKSKLSRRLHKLLPAKLWNRQKTQKAAPMTHATAEPCQEVQNELWRVLADGK